MEVAAGFAEAALALEVAVTGAATFFAGAGAGALLMAFAAGADLAGVALIGVAFAGALGAAGLAADLGADFGAFFTEDLFTGDLVAFVGFVGLVDFAEVLIVLTLG